MMTVVMIWMNRNRRNQIKKIVLSALYETSKNELPVGIKKIVRSYKNVRLVPYSKHMRRQSLTYQEMIEFAESNDACTDYYASSDFYIVYYNDNDRNIVDSNRYRWNIAHELGHILLRHHVDYKKTRIFRSSLTDAEYDHLEEEADYFTQLILVPHVALLGLGVINKIQLRYICKISRPAAHKRFIAYQFWKTHINKNDFYDEELFHLYYNFIYKKICKNCGAFIIQRYGKYCPICGTKDLQWGDGEMIYEKLETNEYRKLIECPTCKNEETYLEGEFCQICRTPLINKCDNENCEEPLETNARYCPKCGCESIFFRKGILKAWDYQKPNGNSFLHIPDGLEEELPFS